MKACEQGECDLPTTAYRCCRHLSATINTIYTKTTNSLVCRTLVNHMTLLFNESTPASAGGGMILSTLREIH